MCGILAVFGSSLPDLELRKKVIECSQRLRHRGPDWSGYLVETGNGIGHERLAIIDPESGEQPLYSKDKKIVVAANGEIYNYKELYEGLKTKYTPLTGSDCEVCIPLYEEHGVDFPKYLRGMFSLVIYDRRDGISLSSWSSLLLLLG
jgi:asparagine synthase (glutamine-hydrolysing)